MALRLLKVVPITRGFPKELFYFSSKEVNEGALVTIRVRKKEVPALVVASDGVAENRTDIRLSPFPLKKITGVKSQKIFSEPFIRASEKTGRYFLTTTGSVIKELCPKNILENPPAVPAEPKLTERNLKIENISSLLQAPPVERIKFYKNLVRAEFAKNKSVFLCVSSAQKTEIYEKELKKGIEQFVFVFKGKMNKKDLREKWTKALAEKHPLLIIATGLFLSLPRHDIKTIIIDEESSSFYKMRARPFLDLRKVAENLSAETGSSFIMADEISRLTTYKRKKDEEISCIAPVSSKITGRAEELIVDLKPFKSFLSAELKEMLKSIQGKNEQTLLFINRRGHSLSTVCDDCGQVITCLKCETPLVLHKHKEPEFMCHKCLLKIKAVDRCPYCKGWKLKTLGLGIQKLYEEIKNCFPEIKIFRMDSDTIKTQKQGAALVDNYLNTPGGVLIATEMIFSFYGGEFDRVAVASVDGLFNLPDFSVSERIFRLLMRLKMKARKTFLLQTRFPNHPVFIHLLKGDVSGFFRSELQTREEFGYPPFKTFIKITREEKNKEKLLNEVKEIKQRLAKWSPISFAAFTPKIKNRHRFYLLLKLEPRTWPDKQLELSEILYSLPSPWKVEIDPESLL